MRAALLKSPNTPLEICEIPKSTPSAEEVLIEVKACGVCRTDLHIFRGELKAPHTPLIMGHQIVGSVVETGEKVKNLKVGMSVGVPWLGHTCGCCSFCKEEKENLCDRAEFTGFHRNGGFAEFTTCHASFAFELSQNMDPLHTAPLLCAGMIGYRSLKMAGPVKTIGFYGFGAAAHLLIQAAIYKEIDIYAFTRPHDLQTQEQAKKMGAVYASGSDELPPVALDAAIIFAPDGALIPQALKAVKKGGRVVCAGIHMSDIPAFPYATLWEERVIQSVANLTRKDGHEWLALAQKIPIQTQVTSYSLEQINEALIDLEKGAFQGSAVITF